MRDVRHGVEERPNVWGDRKQQRIVEGSIPSGPVSEVTELFVRHAGLRLHDLQCAKRFSPPDG